MDRYQLSTVTVGLFTLQVRVGLGGPWLLPGEPCQGAGMVFVISNIHYFQSKRLGLILVASLPSSVTLAQNSATQGRKSGIQRRDKCFLHLHFGHTVATPCRSLRAHALTCMWVKHLLKQDQHMNGCLLFLEII